MSPTALPMAALLALALPPDATPVGIEDPVAIRFELDRETTGQAFIRLEDVSIGGSRGAAFLDTGAEYSSITVDLGREASLVQARRLPLNTFRGRMTASLSRPAEIVIQDRYRTSAPVLTMPEGADWPTGRLISTAIFRNFTLDFDRMRLLVDAPAPGMTPMAGGKRRGLFYVELAGRSRRHRFIVDTGSAGSRVTEAAAADLQRADGVTMATRRTLTAEGWSALKGMARLDGLRAGDRPLPPMTFAVVPQGDVPVSGFAGVLGLGNMQMFNWRFDNAGGILAAVRDVEAAGAPTVGFYAWHRNDTAVVTGLIEGGAAFRAGVRVGDEVLSLNGAAPRGPEMDAYLRIGNCACSETYRFEILRDGQRLSLTAPQADLFPRR